jgi:hypothetical protein
VQKEKQALDIGNKYNMEDKYQINTLYSKLAVRDQQHKIAVEGLKTIIESNDPMGVAQKTLDAIMDCLPDSM